MKSSKIYTALGGLLIVVVAVVSTIILYPKISELISPKPDPFLLTVREGSANISLLASDFDSNGMTFGKMKEQADVSKRNFDALLLKLPPVTNPRDVANEKIVKEYVSAGSAVAYALRRNIEAHIAYEVAQKSMSGASDTSHCGSDWGSLSMTTCLANVSFSQADAVDKINKTRADKERANIERAAALDRFDRARAELIKVGYQIDASLANSVKALKREF